MNRDELATLIRREVMITPEVVEALGITRGRLNQLVKAGKLVPVIAGPQISIFLRQDVEDRKAETGELREKYLGTRRLDDNHALRRLGPNKYDIIRLPRQRAGFGDSIAAFTAGSWEEAKVKALQIVQK